MFEQLQWKERFMDEAGSFTITVGPEGVSIWLGAPVPVTACYVTPTLCCGVGTEGGLCLLHFGGLHDDERARIVATISAV